MSAASNFMQIFGLGPYSPEAKARRKENIFGILGTPVTREGTMLSAEVDQPYDPAAPIWEQDMPTENLLFSRQDPTTTFEGGLLGGSTSPQQMAAAKAGLLDAGYDAAQVGQIVSPFEQAMTQEIKQKQAIAKQGYDMMKQQQDQANKLRGERTKLLAPFAEAKTQYNSTINALKVGNAASSLAAIFSFMKTLDPRSVVREGEQQMATYTGGVTDALVSMINKAQGQGMGEGARKNIALAVQAIMEGRVADAERISKQYDTLATRAGIEPTDIRSGILDTDLQGIPTSFYNAADVKAEMRRRGL